MPNNTTVVRAIVLRATADTADPMVLAVVECPDDPLLCGISAHKFPSPSPLGIYSTPTAAVLLPAAAFDDLVRDTRNRTPVNITITYVTATRAITGFTCAALESPVRISVIPESGQVEKRTGTG